MEFGLKQVTSPTINSICRSRYQHNAKVHDFVRQSALLVQLGRKATTAEFSVTKKNTKRSMGIRWSGAFQLDNGPVLKHDRTVSGDLLCSTDPFSVLSYQGFSAAAIADQSRLSREITWPCNCRPSVTHSCELALVVRDCTDPFHLPVLLQISLIQAFCQIRPRSVVFLYTGKRCSYILPLTLPKADRFPEFFHRQT